MAATWFGNARRMPLWALSPLDVEDAVAVHQAEVRAFTELPPSLRVMPLDRKPGRGWAGALTARDDEVTARADPLGAVSVRPQVSLRALRALLVRGMATAHAPAVAWHLPPSAVTRHRRPGERREPALVLLAAQRAQYRQASLLSRQVFNDHHDHARPA